MFLGALEALTFTGPGCLAGWQGCLLLQLVLKMDSLYQTPGRHSSTCGRGPDGSLKIGLSASGIHGQHCTGLLGSCTFELLHLVQEQNSTCRHMQIYL